MFLPLPTTIFLIHWKCLLSEYIMMRITWGGKKQLYLPHMECKSGAKEQCSYQVSCKFMFAVEKILLDGWNAAMLISRYKKQMLKTNAHLTSYRLSFSQTLTFPSAYASISSQHLVSLLDGTKWSFIPKFLFLSGSQWYKHLFSCLKNCVN